MTTPRLDYATNLRPMRHQASDEMLAGGSSSCDDAEIFALSTRSNTQRWTLPSRKEGTREGALGVREKLSAADRDLDFDRAEQGRHQDPQRRAGVAR